MRIAILAVIFALASAGLIHSAGRAEQPKGALRAGAAAVKITPSLDRTVYIAGYAINRVATSVHDDLWARGFVVEDGATRLAVVSCDLVGLSNYRVRRIRERIKAVPGENVLIATTHVHSGPDTLGLWGKAVGSSGMDPAYMTELEEKITQAVETAAAALKPATLSVGTVEVPDGLVYNSREPVQDRLLTALRYLDGQGKTIASVIHYGGHPEVNKSNAMTSDYVHYVREMAEQRFGGTAIYLNGALGGMVTPKVSGHTLEEMERVGKGVGAAAVQALEAGRPVTVERLAVRRREIGIPLENDGFKLMLGAKVLEGELKDGKLESEVWRMDIGPVTWITLPGEILPKPALDLKSRMPGKYPMVVSMANDEVGYILDPSDFGRPLYKYEKSMSVGKQAWPVMDEAARELLK